MGSTLASPCTPERQSPKSTSDEPPLNPVAELRERCGSMTEAAGGSGLTFRHLAASSGVEPLISNPDNAGAVFMVASQFNALEMVSPDHDCRAKKMVCGVL